MENIRTKVAILAGLTLVSGAVGAQQFEDAASLEFGGFDVTPTVDVGLRYDDNVTRATEDQIESWAQIISPQVNMVSSLGASQVVLAYRLRNGRYYSSKTDNYNDHFLSANIDLEMDARNRLTGTVKFEDGHNARGTGYSIGNSNSLTEPDQYKQTMFDLGYSYGAFNADGRLEANLNIANLDYDINTAAYLARDRILTSLGATFLYRIGATTDATFDIVNTDVSYKSAIDPSNVLDSTNRSYLVGLRWEATAKTSGFAKVGYQEKNFDSSSREDFDGFDWSVGVTWQPVDYSNVRVITRSDTNETNGEGNFIRGRTHSLEWNHTWLERLRTSAGVTWNNNRYEGELIDGFTIREDDNLGFDASVYYQFRRWLNIEVGYKYDERDSNRTTINYDRNQFLINALITL